MVTKATARVSAETFRWRHLMGPQRVVTNRILIAVMSRAVILVREKRPSENLDSSHSQTNTVDVYILTLLIFPSMKAGGVDPFFKCPSSNTYGRHVWASLLLPKRVIGSDFSSSSDAALVSNEFEPEYPRNDERVFVSNARSRCMPSENRRRSYWRRATLLKRV